MQPLLASIVDGALLGGLLGLSVALGVLAFRTRWAKGFAARLEAGDLAGARAVLDERRPASDRLTLTGLLKDRDRMAGLALLGDAAALEAEAAAHTGPLTALAQVDAVALLGLATIGSDPAAAAQRLTDLAQRVEAEGGSMLAGLKKQTHALADLARAAARSHRDAPSARSPAALALVRQGKLVEAVVALAVHKARPASPAEGEGDPASLRIN